MAKRGKVLRDPLAGPGLLIVEGRQYQFVLDSIWKSDIPPKPGLVVDIEFDARGKIDGIIAVSDAQLAKEHAEVTIASDKRRTWPQVLSQLTYSGLVQFVAAVLLIVSWFFLTAISVEVPFTGTIELTLWQLLHYLGSGTYGFLGLIAVAGTFVHHFWNDRQAGLGGLLPLSFMLLISVVLFRNIDTLVANGGDRLYQHARNQVREELLSTISLGLGTYVSIGIGVYFGLLGVRQFRQSKQSEKKVTGQLQKAAA